MAHIACNSKNSFAVDMNGDLYTWGSAEAGLLGELVENDQMVPHKIRVQNGYDDYCVEQINAGTFHVGVIANRVDIIKKSFKDLIKELDDSKELFDEMKKWFAENIRVNSPQEFIRLMLRKGANVKEQSDVKYEEFEKLFLEPFFAYLQLYKKDFFHMKETYREYLSEMFGLTTNTNTFNINHLDKIGESKNPKIKDLYEFALNTSKYFADCPEDFLFFAKLVFKFKPYINDQDVKELFNYCPFAAKRTESELNMKIQRIVNILNIEEKIKGIYEKNKRLPAINFNEKTIESNVLIDCILQQQTGCNKVFTWGVHSESRLGYKSIDQAGFTKNEDDEVQIQKIPKLVYFRNNIKIRSLSCGFFHTLALTEERNVYAWGSSKYGCLGKYLPENQPTPLLIETDLDNQKFTEIIQIAAGMYMSLALNDKGKVFSWGLGNNGRLGQGDENSIEKPKVIQYFVENDIKIKQIACGDLHCAAISTIKELFTWGNGNYGKLGHCNFEHMLLPTKVGFFSMSKVENVVCGSFNTIAVTTDSKIFAWGKNSHGMLGIPHLQDQNILIPQEVLYQKDDPSLIVSEIALGSMHQLILCTNGQLYSCGNSVEGVLGVEGVIDKVVAPIKVESTARFFQKTQKEIMKESPLFKEYSADFSLDVPSTKLSNSVVFVDCSTFNSAFITNTGELYMTGQGKLIPESDKTKETDNNGIDNNNIKDKFITKISYFREKVYYISLGKSHVLCVADGKAYSWGMNYYGMCGLSGKGINECISKPTLIEALKTNIKMCCVSDTHSLVLTTNGEIYAFGNNMYGKLGIGDLNKYFTIGATPMEAEPILVKNVTSAQYIACSNSHSACVMKYNQDLKDSYSVYTWGSGFNGKLGHNGSQDSYEPKVVEELEMKFNEAQSRKLYFIKVALGEEFSIALDECGKLWGWGKKKYLPGLGSDPEGKAENPIPLLEKKTFKFIAAKGNYASAITINGEMYSWGEIIVEDNILKYDFNEVSNEKMVFVSVGFNHCGSIDLSYQPYTWGSNLYNKCGYESLSQENVEVINLPKRIEAFYEQFNFNDNTMNAENKEANGPQPRKGVGRSTMKESTEDFDKAAMIAEKAKREGRDETQMKLMDEPLDHKNLGLMIRDIKINKEFFEGLQSFFKNLQIVEESKTQMILDTEDKIISLINKSECKTNKTYKSEVPLILAQNFQHYEAFIQLLQSHPCYLQKLYPSIPNPNNFMEIIYIIFGKNNILLRNKRTTSNLLGLWNSIFVTFDLKSRDYDVSDSILYSLYELLFKISEDNVQIANELISLVILQLISKTLEKDYIDLEKQSENLIIKYKQLIRNNTEKMKKYCKTVLINYLSDLFSDLNINSHYSYSILWIFRQLVNFFKKNQSGASTKENNEKLFNALNKNLNYFIFKPCQEIIKTITEAHETNLPPEYYTLMKAISETLLKSETKELFPELLNDYKVKKEIIDNNVFKLFCMPKSEVLKDILDIFSDISSSIEEIPKFIKNIKEYDFDFSLTAVKETCKQISETGNEQVTIPMTISNLILLQTSFEAITLNKLDPNDPLRKLLNDMKDFSIKELGTTSTINNTVVNLSFNPYGFYYRSDIKVDMIKCQQCLLPIPSILLKDSQREECMNGFGWTCDKCNVEYDVETIECTKCGQIKQKKDIKSKSFFFKRYYIGNNDELALLLEKVLYILPSLYKHDDILKEVNLKLNVLRDSKEKLKEKPKIAILEKFKAKLNYYKEHMQGVLGGEKEILAKTKLKIEENIERRTKHCSYLQKIEDSIAYIGQMAENAKVNFSYFEKKIGTYTTNIQRGYVTPYFIKYNRIIPKINRNETNKNAAVAKVFLVKDLIDKKVINEILFDGKDQPKLVQKSYLEFEKTDKGFEMRLSYKEKYQKFVVCGTIKHNYNFSSFLITNENVLYLRSIARHNPVFEFGNISFNSFYLVNLLNSLIKA